MKKKDREEIYYKYGGRCAYCGNEIEYKDMQVDHKIPADWIGKRTDYNYNTRKERKLTKKEMIQIHGQEKYDRIFGMENLMPTCRRCNHYKRWQDLEHFRKSMIHLHDRVNDTYIVRVAISYGLIGYCEKFNGEFYFETVDKSKEGK